MRDCSWSISYHQVAGPSRMDSWHTLLMVAVIISHCLGGGGLMLPWVQHGALNSDPNGEAWLGAERFRVQGWESHAVSGERFCIFSEVSGIGSGTHLSWLGRGLLRIELLRRQRSFGSGPMKDP